MSAVERISAGASVEETVAAADEGNGITLALVYDRLDLLPAPYVTKAAAWRRLDGRQRALVRALFPGDVPVRSRLP